MRRRYKTASYEEAKNVRKAFFFIFLTVVLLGLLFFFGIPLIAKFATFIAELGKSDDPITREDNIPPAPPHLENLPEATNKFSLDIRGTTESGATVIIDFNGSTQEILAGSEGEFTQKINLLDGKNTIVLTARDAAGNISQPTETFSVLFDNEDPDLVVSSPQDGTEYYGSGQRQVTIQGSTDVDSKLTINDKLVSLNEKGEFNYTTTLSEGENKFSIKASDQAGNEKEISLTLKFNP